MTPWTVTHQALLSMGFSRQEYWSGLPFPPPDLPDPGVKPVIPALQADSLPLRLQRTLAVAIFQLVGIGEENAQGKCLFFLSIVGLQCCVSFCLLSLFSGV